MTNFKTGGPWITRFAPSPTGILHLGNARTAILNFLLAKQSGGKFLLRLEDTDQERSTFSAEAAILWSLAWMGIVPDETPRHQSLRLDRYHAAVSALMDAGLAYPCFCSEAELDRDRQDAARHGLPPRYSGRCAALDPHQRAERLLRGDAHTVRFRMTRTDEVHFTDLIKGDIRVPADAFGDFVLLRSNGWPSYNLAVVVDDADMGVNLVLRGEDHLTNTARQLLLYEAFGHTPPVFAHHGLLLDTEGRKLSKRTSALSIPECIAAGLEPRAVTHALAALSGALPGKELFSSLEDMARRFNPFALGRGNAVLNMEEVRHLSAAYFRTLDLDVLCRALDGRLPPGDPWHAFPVEVRHGLAACLRENAQNMDDLLKILPTITATTGPVNPSLLAQLATGQDVFEAFANALTARAPESCMQPDDVRAELGQIMEATGKRGKALYHPLRLALTGADHGPELATLLTVMPVGWIRARIHDALNLFLHCNTHKE